MVERDEKFPPPVEVPDDVEQAELPLVDDIEPKEPTPNVDEGSVPAEERDGLPPTRA
jgi:hypothetical protein